MRSRQENPEGKSNGGGIIKSIKSKKYKSSEN